MRRSSHQYHGHDDAADTLVVGDLVMSIEKATVTLASVPVQLTACEFALLECFMRRPRACLSVNRLMIMVYNEEDPPQDPVIRCHIHALRKKIGGSWISNRRGFGYTLASPAVKMQSPAAI